VNLRKDHYFKKADPIGKACMLNVCSTTVPTLRQKSGVIKNQKLNPSSISNKNTILGTIRRKGQNTEMY